MEAFSHWSPPSPLKRTTRPGSELSPLPTATHVELAGHEH